MKFFNAASSLAVEAVKVLQVLAGMAAGMRALPPTQAARLNSHNQAAVARARVNTSTFDKHYGYDYSYGAQSVFSVDLHQMCGQACNSLVPPVIKIHGRR